MKGTTALVLAALLTACQQGEPPRSRATGDRAAAPSPTAATAHAQADLSPSERAEIAPASKWAVSKRIAWHSAEAGLAAAKREGKPVMMVIKTEWCRHCKKFAKLFDENSVVDAARNFVMVLVDGDRDPIAKQYAPDGTYVPRTFFLSPDGAINAALVGPNPRYRHFLNTGNAAALVHLMEQARL